MVYTVEEALKEVLYALGTRDISLLRKVGDRAMGSIAVEEDKDLLDLALISYVLAKLMEKPRYWDKKEKRKFIEMVNEKMTECAHLLDDNKIDEFRERLAEVTSVLHALDKTDRRYIQDLFHKARLKFASYLYAQGQSLSNAAMLTGASKKDIMNYSGKTLMHDRSGTTKSIKERLKYVRRLFA